MKKIKTLLALIMLIITTGTLFGQFSELPATAAYPLTVNITSQNADEATITVVCIYSNGGQDAEMRTIPLLRKNGIYGNVNPGTGSTIFSIVTNEATMYLTNMIIVISTDDGEYTTLTYNGFVSTVNVDFRN